MKSVRNIPQLCIDSFMYFDVVYFPSQFKSQYRVKINVKSDEAMLWIEERSSRKQWQTTVVGINDKEDPHGLPFTIVLSALKKACELNRTYLSNQNSEYKSNTPRADIQIDGDILTLNVSLDVSGLYQIEYFFYLELIALDIIDEIQEQISELVINLEKMSKINTTEPIYINLSSDTPVNAYNIIEWGSDYPKALNEEYFHVSEDNTSIAVLMTGVYQVIIKVTHSDGHGIGIELLCNGIEIGVSYNTSTGTISTILFSEIFRFDASSTLQVRSGIKDDGISNNPLTNKFTILKL